MRIRRLDLDFFGHFTARRFDFGEAGTGADFHIIHGPNEAGKTTTKEAFLRLLYGFPNREPYDFQHQRKNLRVSALLETAEGARAFTRLPTRAASLVDETGTALPETALTAHLGGLSLDDYRNLLCLDDETIERGGEDIANARGDIGRLLFSAAAGVADLNAVLEAARDEADKLYRKRASTTRMASLKKELAEVEREIRDNDISANAWRRLRQARDQAAEEEDAVRQERADLRRQAADVDARRRALPLINEIDDLEKRIAPHAQYPARVDISSEDLEALRDEQTRAANDAERLEDEIVALQQALAGLEPDPEGLAIAKPLDELDTLRSRYNTAGIDLPKRRAAVREALQDMARAAADLRVDEAVAPESLVCSTADLADLEAARAAMQAAERDRTSEAAEVEALETRLREAVRAHEAQKRAAPAASGISAILDRFDADSLASAHAAARAAVDEARRQARDGLDALGLAGRRFDNLPSCPLTADDARDLAGRLSTLERKIAEQDDRIAGYRETAAVHTAQIERLTAAGTVIADLEAKSLMEQRDTLWSAHRKALTGDSADMFETAMRQVDDMARTRLARARELAALRQAEQGLSEAAARAVQGERQRDALETQKAAIEARIADAASAAGLDPATSPSAFFPWIDRLAAAGLAARQRQAVEDRHRPVLEKADALVQALRPFLDLAEPEFDACLTAARRLARAERDHADALKAAMERVQELQRDLAGRKDRLDRREAQAATARQAWTERVQRLFDGRIGPETLEPSLEPLRRLREHDSRRTSAERQVSGMEEDQRQFSGRVDALAAALASASGTETGGGDPLATFDALRHRAEQAIQTEDRRKDGETRLVQKRQALQAARRRLDEIDREVRQLAAIFPAGIPVATLAELRTAVALAGEIGTWRERLSACQRQVLDILSVADLSAARLALADATAAGLQAQADNLASDLEAIDLRITKATEARVSTARDLAAVTGDADIARLVERRTTLELAIEETALDYLELSLGLQLAETAIRRYRDTHRSGMMAATETVFATLTNGAYRKLLTQPEGSSEILLVTDAAGTAKRVEDLSKGTRFQLYLALRAAAYEQLGSQGIHLPFFCDDIFETFDEDRTRAACRIMQRIGGTGQAIYLTHHRHVVDIAREVCPDGVRIHEIA